MKSQRDEARDEATDAYVYDAVRTPRGKGKPDGALHRFRPVDLAAQVLIALRERNKIPTEFIDDVILGCVTAVGEQGGNISKTAAMYANYHERVSGVTVNRFCGSGLEAINQAAARVRSGFEGLIAAGGVESMSRVPMMSDGGAWPMDPQVATKTSFVPQGISADLIASLYKYSRQTVDAYAMESQKRASLAWEEKRFARSIIPVRSHLGDIALDRDELVRPDTNMDTLAKLSPSFEKLGREGGFDSVALQKYPGVEKIEHVHHPGNSSGIVDGAAVALIGSARMGKELGLKPRAKILSYAVTSSDPTIMLTGPAPATREAIKRAGLEIKDIDLFEVNEAFASVVLRFMEDLGVPHSKVNKNGGAIAMGHPLGATGAILAGTLIDELERSNLRYGVVTLCIGGGMGIATVFERIREGEFQ